MKINISQYLPAEFLTMKRFFPVGKEKSNVPTGWSNPENQMLFDEALKKSAVGNVGFDTSGHEQGADYLMLDFDHVLDDNGEFVNDDARKWFLWIRKQLGGYCERSISGHGIHILAKPTAGKFPRIVNKKGEGVLYFDEANNVKLEIFYKTAGRYCLLTGNLFDCEAGASIAEGVVVDNVLETLLAQIKPPEQKKSAKTVPTTEHSHNTEKISLEVEELKNRINATVTPADLSAKGYLQRSENGAPEPTGYICPWCRSGTHEHKTGALTWYEVPNPHFACHAHGCGGDVIKFLSQIYGIDNRGADYFALIRKAADDFKIPYDAATFNIKSRPEMSLEAAQDVSNGDDVPLTREQEFRLFSGDLSDEDFARRIYFMYPSEFRYLQNENRWLINRRNNHGGGVFEDRGEQSSAVGKFALKLRHTLFVNVGSEPQCPPITQNADGIPEMDKKAHDEYKRQLKLYQYKLDVAKHLKKTKNISQAVTMLKNFEQITIGYEDLNRNKNLLNVLNGVVDLQTGNLMKYHADFLLTRQAAAAYDPNVDTSFVEKFFADILPDENTRHAVWRYLGYCLTGEKNYHISEMWQGGGANGKSTALDVIMKLFGTYAKKLPAAGILESRRPADGNAATPAISQLADDVRLAVIDELPRNCRIDTALFKTLTGDETAYSRELYCKPRLVELRAKLLINGNHLPTFDVDDDGMLRRINRVPFTQRFSGERADPNLPAKLSTPENLSALLKICVDEAVAYYRNGLLESDEMREAKEDYIVENDFVRNFLVDNCITGHGGEISRKALEDKLREAYPRECSRLKKKDLLDALINHLEPHGAYYEQTTHKRNVFKNIQWLDNGSN